MLRIAITGSPGVGKSTVCRNVLKQLTCTYGGMVSADIRVKGERVGFEIRDIATGRQGILAHKEGTGPRVGSYHVNLADLNNIGVAAIRNALNSELVVIDEIAPMEFKSPEFIRAVEEALDSDKNMLVVLHQKSSHPLAERIRREFRVYTATRENRERLVYEIAGKTDTLKTITVK
ncbi:putative nucleotide kinase [Candidatus Methanoperedens nitroreducens]|uniref:Nucleoside-triphosphatase ANME2D_01517 n=1 Tax=Candidatus Methanoperedens nitratireducens TaxID=1392998 RepID=A0A062V9T8_9EURY|nr:NTPase [Candidatus Methanoperedens nitroreducens]KCZ72115.1 putative nucleotide kinase [Candidatus Methanoperedens nitroreducens]MDJ1421908.1 NTPase [Candidatus Methanoperedens sp.]